MANLTRFKHLKVAIAIPSMGAWTEQFAISLQNMLTAFNQHRVEEYKSQEVQVVSTRSSMLPRARFLAVKDALKMNATHLLWIDCDHKFPRKLLHALVHDDKDVVGINHVTKTIPAQPTARGKPQPGGYIGGEQVFSDPTSPKLEKVWRLGCGTMLVKMHVYKATGPAVFDMVYDPAVDDYRGEDWSMCQAFEAHGFDIWVDHELSLMCSHIGAFEFTHDWVGELTNVGPAHAQAA